MELSVYWVYLTSFFIASATYWIYKWRNPKCNGKLPPGSTGFPLIGETLEFLIPSKSLDIHNFFKKRMIKYGSLFRTNILGRSVVVSADPDFNYYLLQQEGKLVEIWYTNSLLKIVGFDDYMVSILRDESKHRQIKNSISAHFGVEALKQNLLSQLEAHIKQSLQIWSKQKSIETQHACSLMLSDFTKKMLFSYDSKKLEDKTFSSPSNFTGGVALIPFNIPGTAFYDCLKNQKDTIKIITNLFKERRNNSEIRKGDFIDQVLEEMKTKGSVWTEDLGIKMIFALSFASVETLSTTIASAIKFLTDNPSTLCKLEEENEAVLKNRENKNSGLSWQEYKSMTHTQHVINESLRLSSSFPGILRRAITDIQIKGYTIPKGWTILMNSASIHLNPNFYKDPLTFNPSRWEDMNSVSKAKAFIPFGAGLPYCPGAEFSRVLMATFFHVLVTEYKWTKIKEGDMGRYPLLGFANGFRINLTEKQN